MPRAREQLVSVIDTPYYHVISRCVRRTFLCGTDHETGRSYEYRRQWIEDRIRILASVFAVEICAYAVMSNHYHLVLKLIPEDVKSWSDEQVLARWTSLHKGPALVQRYMKGDDLHPAEMRRISVYIEEFRQRLASLSWFMKCLNEPIARQANREDDCTGHFWESRFKSQALRSEEALLSCMAYVDLNPVRAGMASTPETSEHTSISERVSPVFDLEKAIHEQIEHHALQSFEIPLKPLLHFEGGQKNADQRGLLFSLSDYLELVDFTGRTIAPGKRGAIPSTAPPVLERLGIAVEDWLEQTTEFPKWYQRQTRCRRLPTAA